MKIVPQNNNILCRQINSTKHEVGKFIVFEKEELPIYEILDVSKCLKDFRFIVGDNVICNSTGTRVNVDNNLLFLFKAENIVGKVN